MEVEKFLRCVLYFMASMLLGINIVLILFGYSDLVFSPISKIQIFANKVFIFIGPIGFIHLLFSILKKQ